jgi:hypothetical protein
MFQTSLATLAPIIIRMERIQPCKTVSPSVAGESTMEMTVLGYVEPLGISVVFFYNY